MFELNIDGKGGLQENINQSARSFSRIKWVAAPLPFTFVTFYYG